MNKSSNVMGKSLQKEITEIKDEVSNSEFILKAKTQRIKDLKMRLNELNSYFESLNLKLSGIKTNYNTAKNNNTNNPINDSVYLTNNNLNIQSYQDFENDNSIELNFLNKNNAKNNYYYNNKSLKNNKKNHFKNNTNKINILDLEKYSSDVFHSNLICNISNFSDTSNLNTTINNEKEGIINKNSENNIFLKKNKLINEMGFLDVLEESEYSVKLKEEIEENLKKLQIQIFQKESFLEKLLNEFEEGQISFKNLEEVFKILKIENSNNEKRYKNIINFFENHESFIKKFESEMIMLKNRIEVNKSIYERLEKEIIIKLYFVRFSNSMVRSLFNIINIRRLHIEMLKVFSKKDMESYKNLFKKLDDTEFKILKDYDEFILFINKEDNRID